MIYAFLFILNLIEGYHDANVIKDLKNSAHSKQWHIASFIYYAAIIGYLIYTGEGWDAILIATLFRLSIFPLSLNYFRFGKNLFYLGDKGIDGLLKKVFGKQAGIITIIGALIILIIWKIK